MIPGPRSSMGKNRNVLADTKTPGEAARASPGPWQHGEPVATAVRRGVVAVRRRASPSRGRLCPRAGASAGAPGHVSVAAGRGSRGRLDPQRTTPLWRPVLSGCVRCGLARAPRPHLARAPRPPPTARTARPRARPGAGTGGRVSHGWAGSATAAGDGPVVFCRGWLWRFTFCVDGVGILVWSEHGDANIDDGRDYFPPTPPRRLGGACGLVRGVTGAPSTPPDRRIRAWASPRPPTAAGARRLARAPPPPGPRAGASVASQRGGAL